MPDLDKKRLGANIRLLRERAQMTQGDLLRRLDDATNQGMISRWENGHEAPNLTNLTNLAGVFGTTIDGLLFGEGMPTEGEAELHEFTIWLRTMKPSDLTEGERASLAAIRWPADAGAPEPEWYDDALTMLRGVQRKAERRRRGPAH